VIERPVSLTGGKAHCLARILPYRNATNVIDGVLLTFIDVSSIVAAEEQQKVLAAETQPSRHGYPRRGLLHCRTHLARRRDQG
jgi:hypothetical protein